MFVFLLVLFWFSLAFVFYAFAGYPLFLKVVGLFFQKGELEESGESIYPPISIVLVVWNEEGRIGARIQNLLDCEYPGEREIVLVCDGCSDGTVDRALAVGGHDVVIVVEVPERRGKANGLNKGVEVATGKVLVFADARQTFDREALVRLVKPMLHDEKVAAVSGNLEIESSDEGAGAGIDAYWKLEKWIRNQEAQIDSVIGCTGAIYALRKSAFSPIPEDTLIDDVVIPMQALVAGNRIAFESKAIAFDPQTLDPDRENRRKMRTLAGNYQMLFRYPSWLFPWGNRCWWQLISHKYSRLFAPFFLILALVSSALLAVGSVFYLVLFLGQVGCWGLAVFGALAKGARSKVLTIPAGFAFLQWQSLRALLFYLTRTRNSSDGTWG